MDQPANVLAQQELAVSSTEPLHSFNFGGLVLHINAPTPEVAADRLIQSLQDMLIKIRIKYPKIQDGNTH